MREPDADNELGARIRKLRLERKMAARELAEKAGVTPAYVSRLENGRVSPTVSTLTRVMRALGAPVAHAFGEDEASGLVVRRGERRLIQNRGVADRLLTPSSATRLEVLETEVESGAGSGEAYSHPGDEECVVVLEGVFRLWVNDEQYDLQEGDSITFPCRAAHRWMNPGSATSRLVWIITPASY